MWPTSLFQDQFKSHVCWFASSTRSPCGPNRISLMKLIIATQMTGATSTPPIGLIRLLVGPKTGSVGRTAMEYGNLLAGS